MELQQWSQIQVRQLRAARRKLGILDPEVRTWFVSTADKTISNTTAETSMFGTGEGTLTFPANTFKKVGRTAKIFIVGTHTMDATPPTITFRVKLGGTTLASVTYTDLNDTNRFFELDFTLTCRSIGASGSFIGQGRIIMAEFMDDTETYELLMMAPASLDTTADLAVDVTAQPNIADPNSSLRFTNSYVSIIY